MCVALSRLDPPIILALTVHVDLPKLAYSGLNGINRFTVLDLPAYRIYSPYIGFYVGRASKMVALH